MPDSAAALAAITSGAAFSLDGWLHRPDISAPGSRTRIRRDVKIWQAAPRTSPSDGQIAEIGTHEKLLERGGSYAAMWAAFTGEAELVA